MTDEGEVRRRSTVYTEYFVRGTAPTGVCELHSSRGVFGTIASWFGGGEAPRAPAEAAETPASAAVTAAAGPAAAADPAEPEEPPQRRRGFWSRVFGIGGGDDQGGDDRDDEDRDREERNEPRERPRPRPRPIPGAR